MSVQPNTLQTIKDSCMDATKPAYAVVPEADVIEAYEFAEVHSSHAARHHPHLEEDLRDSAIDGVMWARDHYYATRGDFGKFARAIIRMCVRRAIMQFAEKRKRGSAPVAVSLEELVQGSEGETLGETIAAKEIGDSLTIQDLPEEMRNAVKLYMIHGYDFRDCGLLLGVAAETVRTRLVKAAEILSPGERMPARRNGEKRLAAG